MQKSTFKYVLLIIWVVFSATTSGQSLLSIDKEMVKFRQKPKQKPFLFHLEQSTLRIGQNAVVSPLGNINLLKISPALAFNQSGWVCKKEWLFQKKTGIPLFIRLGSKTAVDYLERKQR